MGTEAADTRNIRAVIGDSALLRKIGFWALAASVINNTIGGGIFALPRTLAESMGPAAPLALVLGAIVFIPIALCFSAAGSRIHATGGPYSYVTAAFGEFPGFVIGAILWISNVAADGGIAAALADQAQHVSPLFTQPLPRASLIIGVFAILCVLNARGVRIGARAVMAFATVKLLPLILLATLGLLYVHPLNLHIAAVPGRTAIGGSMVAVIFAYAGMETALMPSGEVSDPSRVVPRATMTAIALVVLIYIGLQVVAQGILGSALANNTAPLAATAGAIAPFLSPVLLLTAIVSQFGYLHNDLLGSSRLLYALGRDGYLPAPLARITPNHRVPLIAVLTHAIGACVMAIIGNFDGLILLSGGAVCLAYLGCCAAAWRLQYSDQRGEGTPFQLRGGPLIPLIGCAGLVLVLSTLQKNEWHAIGYALLALIAIYGIVRWVRGSKDLPAS
jgi:APA family basic amino acid/polyamine antiporter